MPAARVEAVAALVKYLFAAQLPAARRAERFDRGRNLSQNVGCLSLKKSGGFRGYLYRCLSEFGINPAAGLPLILLNLLLYFSIADRCKRPCKVSGPWKTILRQLLLRL